MQWAEGGSLDDFIDVRMGRTSATHPPESNESPSPEPISAYSRGARIRAFRAMQHASPEERERLRREMSGIGMHGSGRNRMEWKPVHLLSADEIKSLFKDVVEGLAFLVSTIPFYTPFCSHIGHFFSTTSLSSTLTSNPEMCYSPGTKGGF